MAAIIIHAIAIILLAGALLFSTVFGSSVEKRNEKTATYAAVAVCILFLIGITLQVIA